MKRGNFYECDYHGDNHIVFDTDMDGREWKIIRHTGSGYVQVFLNGSRYFDCDLTALELLWRLIGQSIDRPVPKGCPESIRAHGTPGLAPGE